MKYNVIGYLIGEGFSNVFKNKKSTISALGIMCATMIVFGIFFAITENVNNMIKKLEAQQGIQVFIELNATNEEVREIGDRIRTLDGVNTVQYVSQEEGLQQVKENFGDKGDILEGLEGVLPVAYKVTFTDLSKSQSIQEEIDTWDNIRKITSKNETTTTLMSLGNGIKIVSGVILVFLIVVSIFIISNTIKLTVHARRKEISIMKYVGATNSFIRWPFVVEGIVIGLAAALLSLLIIGLGYNVVAENIMQNELIAKIGVEFVSFNELFPLIVSVYVILGIGIGVVGSMISMKKYLEV